VTPTPSAPAATARRVVLLGSTGSVGTQAIDIVAANPDRFRVVGLAAGGSRLDLLAAQALDLGVEIVGVSRGKAAEELTAAFFVEADLRGWNSGEARIPKVVVGAEAAAEVAAWDCDVVLNGITGSVGLGPTLAALAAGRTLALANKESLIAGGSLVKAAARPGQIVPVDSEHSALAQCLRSGHPGEVSRLVLTASGGPFRGRSRADLGSITAAEALAHPTWDMGPVVTINSATLMNKGLEVIEAHLLFDVPLERIDVVVHPQSVVHSMVTFVDGATIAQASPPDMHLPIALALAWPNRIADAAAACDWTAATSWDFEPVDSSTFPAIDLCREAVGMGGCSTAVLNAANEECVEAFVAGRLPFLGIVDTVADVVHGYSPVGAPTTIAEVIDAETWARAHAQELIEKAAA
jgi:1-deoxy-D-xylulose-5-phosphate reductoisomerase